MIFWGKIDTKMLLPSFKEDVERVLTNSEFSWYVTEGYRSIERSNQLYQAYVNGTGPRAAPGGKSAHNYGLAIDVALDSDLHIPGLQPDWTPSTDDGKADGWLWLRGVVNAHPRLRGGWWYHDWPHIERYKWQEFKNWRS